MPSAHARTQSYTQDSPNLIRARRVLRAEASALNQLADELDTALDAVVNLLLRIKGRLVVTGMGKSGHVGRKIAATLASTGTPAQFVHPSEASHGDLGMIGLEDAVLALSNSGATTELGDTLAYCVRQKIPLIAITKNQDSTLAQMANHVLLLPQVQEACPHNLAPTTSTTLQIALGDALAVALMEQRGFAPENFQTLHPGGALGYRLLRVSQLAQNGDQVPLVQEGVSLDEALLVMSAKGKGCVGVVDAQGHLSGVMTDGDLRRARLKAGSLQAMNVDEVMSREPRTIAPEALATQAIRELNRLRITGLFVVDGEGKPEGFVHIHDLLRAGLR